MRTCTVPRWLFWVVLIVASCERPPRVTGEVADKYAALLDKMTTATESAKQITSEYSSTWSDAISNSRDFNIALGVLRESGAMREKVKDLQTTRTAIEEEIRLLRDGLPREAFETVVVAYGQLTRLVLLAQNPSGSLQTFNQTVGTLASEIAGSLAAAALYLPAGRLKAPEPPKK